MNNKLFDEFLNSEDLELYKNNNIHIAQNRNLDEIGWKNDETNNFEYTIKEEYPEEVVMARFDDEVLEWVDDNWEEDYESEYDWYIDHNNGEAQDVVIGELIDWYTTEHGEIDFDISDFSDTLREEYGI